MECDCTKCKAGNEEEAQAMAITRAKAKLKSPLDWEDQRKVREKVTNKLDALPEEMGVQSGVGQFNSEAFYEELFNTPLQVTLGQFLDTAPLFKQRMMSRLGKNPTVGQNAQSYGLEPADVDFSIPMVKVEYNQTIFEDVLLDS